MPENADQKKLHYDLTNVGLRAQATAAGLLQLCRELQQTGALDNNAIDRIKGVITHEIMECAPRAIRKEAMQREVQDRIDRLFAAQEHLGPGGEVAFGPSDGS
ncbi:hypothetical protein [Sphingobium sp. EM0848]|uniref:hypothetical protein n=1 Tax=Sphingobium sp. EM0848 TaxID=2743473 RepID=UPI00159C195A|nr:hypothetical protein [Sphingobium sp. EM0848]